MFKKCIGITQKVIKHPRYEEVLDCLDQRWSDLLLHLDLQPLPLPNIEPRFVKTQLSNLSLDGLILSGGNSITAKTLQGNNQDDLLSDFFPKRDSYEHQLLRYAIKAKIPVLGVCRGMQLINLFYGGDIVKIKGHASSDRHSIIHRDHKLAFNLPEIVNSYHNYGIPPDMLATPLEALACDKDDRIEAFTHKEEKVTAIMWHPERETPFIQSDLDLLKRIF